MKTTPETTDATQAGHTPGPWEAHGCAIYQAESWKDGIKSGGAFVAIAHHEPFHELMPRDEDLTNARLIAAAPELLEALEAFKEAYLTADDKTRRIAVEHAFSNACAAIAKATKGA